MDNRRVHIIQKPIALLQIVVCQIGPPIPGLALSPFEAVNDCVLVPVHHDIVRVVQILVVLLLGVALCQAVAFLQLAPTYL